MFELMEQQYTCTHCDAKFTKEKTLIVHLCEQKRRHLARDEKHVQMGFQAYLRFYLLSRVSYNSALDFERHYRALYDDICTHHDIWFDKLFNVDTDNPTRA